VAANNRINSALAEAQAWADENESLLQRAYERFDETGEWPQLEDLQHDFTVGGHDDVDVAALAYAMPRPLGTVEQGRLVLFTRALSQVKAAAWLLEAWASAIHIACQRWIRDHKTAWLTRQDVEELTRGDRHKTDLVSQLLHRERWPFGDGRGGPTDDWSQKVVDSARIARDTRDARTLLERRAAVEFPASPPEQGTATTETKGIAPAGPNGGSAEASSVPGTDLPSSAGRERVRRLLHNPYAVVVLGGLLVLLIWAILSNGFNEMIGGGDKSKERPARTTPEEGQDQEGRDGAPPPVYGQRFEEVAGEGGASTYANPHTLSETGKSVEPGQRVKVICRVYAPEPPSVNPDGYWYRIASSPWNGQYYAPANSFWNGDVPGELPYTHNTDKHVPTC
jgi:hypothetical protein